MNKTIEKLKEEITAEYKAECDKAFEIFCKRELARQMDIVDDAIKSLNSKEDRMRAMTIEKLKNEFEAYDISWNGRPRDKIIQELRDNDNKEVR